MSNSLMAPRWAMHACMHLSRTPNDLIHDQPDVVGWMYMLLPFLSLLYIALFLLLLLSWLLSYSAAAECIKVSAWTCQQLCMQLLWDSGTVTCLSHQPDNAGTIYGLFLVLFFFGILYHTHCLNNRLQSTQEWTNCMATLLWQIMVLHAACHDFVEKQTKRHMLIWTHHQSFETQWLYNNVLWFLIRSILRYYIAAWDEVSSASKNAVHCSYGCTVVKSL